MNQLNLIKVFSAVAVVFAGGAVPSSGTTMTPPAPAAVSPASTAVVSATQPASDSTASANLTSAAAYQIAPGDVLTITTIGITDLTLDATVTPDGMINVPLLSPIKASGMTTDQLQNTLKTQWTKYVVNPPVTVALKQKHEQLLTVAGWVNRPGPANYTPNLRVLQAIALAGGALDTADLTHVTVTHRNGTVQTVDLSDPADKGNTAQDVVLQEQDNVFVPQNIGKVEVVGAVKAPGSYQYVPGMKVMDALTDAGGAVIDNVDYAHTTLTHNGIEKPIDVQAMVRGGNMAANVPLMPGDRLLLPVVYNRVYVFGEVQKPGYDDFKPGDRVLDALNSAGVMNTAQLYKVNLIKVDKDKNVAHCQVVDVERFLLKGDITGNPALAPGDVLYIPQKNIPFNVNTLVPALSGLNVLNAGSRIITGSAL